MRSIDKEKLDKLVSDGYIRKSNHSRLPLSLYKYTEKTTFEGNWNDLTLMCRGLVLDEDYNIVANCIPKFFNYEELGRQTVPSINFNQPFTATRKEDGSLIQMFMYNGELVITSSGGFENDYTRKAEELLTSKYDYLWFFILQTWGVNFIFEMITPLTRVVVDYGNREELRLITVRERSGVEMDISRDFYMSRGVDLVPIAHFNSIEELIREKSGKYKNIEGYVLKFADGSRVKFKFDEYFILHKTIAHVSKKFVWESLSKGIDLNLENIPDETFEQIRVWSAELQEDFNQLQYYSECAFLTIPQTESRKTKALYILKEHADISDILFLMVDGKSPIANIWNKLNPQQ